MERGFRREEGLQHEGWRVAGVLEEEAERGAEGLKGRRRAELNGRLLREELRGGRRKRFPGEGGLQSGERKLQLRVKTPSMKVLNPSRSEEERSWVEALKAWVKGRLGQGASKDFFEEELRRRTF